MPSDTINLLLEAEKRGLPIPQDKQGLLNEARRRGLVGGQEDFLPLSEVGKQAIGNLSKSAISLVSNIGKALASPVESAKAIGGLVVGGIETLIPEQLKFTTSENEKLARAFGKDLIDSYGGWEEAKRTFADDPLRVLSDISIPLTGGGGVLAKLVGTSTKAAKVAQVLKSAGRAVDPISAISTGIAKIAERPSVNTLVKSVLAFPGKKGVERIDELAQAFMDQGLNVTRKTLDSIRKDKTNLNKEVRNIIDKKTSEGFVIKTDGLVKAIDELVKNASKEGFELPDLAVINKMKDDFAKQHGATITPQELQNIKVGMGKAFDAGLPEDFGKVRKKFRENIRSKAQSTLEEMYPEIKPLNEKLGVKIELGKAIEKAIVKSEQTRTLQTKGLLVGGIVGGVAGASTGSVAAGLKFAAGAIAVEKIISSPRVQIGLAHVLNGANFVAAKVGRLTPKITRPAFQTGRIQEEAGRNQLAR